MARWGEASDYDMSWYGVRADEVPEEIFNDVMLKIGEYARGAPVRAKVVLAQNTLEDDDMDALCIIEVHGTYYFLVITNAFMLVMDLHYARNNIVAELLESTIHLS